MHDFQLDQLLKSCGTSHAPRGFAADVWNRIAAAPDSAGTLTAWKLFLTETFARLAQPTGALAACAIFVVLGTLAGFGSRPDAQPPELRYIRSVSPFIHQPGR